jgi:hypothetical protein
MLTGAIAADRDRTSRLSEDVGDKKYVAVCTREQEGGFHGTAPDAAATEKGIAFEKRQLDNQEVFAGAA